MPRDFSTIKGRGGKSAPAIQQDLWVWIHGKNSGDLFDVDMQSHEILTPLAKPSQEVRGMTSRGGRNLTGLVDGPANPRGAHAKKVALIAKREAGEGGSYALAMHWIHDLSAFHALPVAGQEAVIGRTKLKDIALKGPANKPDSHISRMEIEVEGEELQIYRRSTSYGDLREHGLYFLAFAAVPSRFSLMLQRMFGKPEDRIEDRLTDISRSVSGSYFFVPSRDLLRSVLI